MTDRLQACLMTVLANPADDGPRLVMADAFEECGECDRAEFIRVGCELAKHTYKDQVCTVCGVLCGDNKSKYCEKLNAIVKDGENKNSHKWSDPIRDSLRRRADELLAEHANGVIWLPDLAKYKWYGHSWSMGKGSPLEFGFQTASGVDQKRAKVIWHRGFIHQVECQLETWRGKPCEECNGNGKYHDYATDGSWAQNDIPCSYCRAIGRVGGIGPLLVRRAPVEAVVVDGKDSRGRVGLGLFWWEEEHDPLTGHDIPVDLFDKLEGFIAANCRPCSDPRRRPARQKFYPSADAANAALSTVLLKEARETPFTEPEAAQNPVGSPQTNLT